MVQMAHVGGAAPAINLGMLLAALREAVPPPPPQPQTEVTKSLLAISQTLTALSEKMDSYRSSGKRGRSHSPSPASSPSPPHGKRSRAKSQSRYRFRSCFRSPPPSHSGRWSPTSSQFSNQLIEEASQPPRRGQVTRS